MSIRIEVDEEREVETVDNNPLYLGLVGAGVVMVLSSMMTWAENDGALQDVAVNGMDGSRGVLIMFIGALVTILGFVGWAYNPWSDPEAGWTLLFSVAGLAIAIWEMVRIQDGIIAPDIGAGLWLLCVTTISAAVLSLIILIAPEP